MTRELKDICLLDSNGAMRWALCGSRAQAPPFPAIGSWSRGKGLGPFSRSWMRRHERQELCQAPGSAQGKTMLAEAGLRWRQGTFDAD